MDRFHRQNIERERTDMAAKTKVTQAPVTIVESPAPALGLAVEADDLAALRLQQQAIQERIRQLKAAEPQMTALEKVIRCQTTSWESWIVRNIANRIQARVNAGQDRQEAYDAVMLFFRNLADERIDSAEREESEARAVEETEEQTND
jgi:hypothetical protein